MQELERRLEETIADDGRIDIDVKSNLGNLFFADVHIESVSEVNNIMNVELEAGHMELNMSNLNEKPNEFGVALEAENGESIEFVFDNITK